MKNIARICPQCIFSGTPDYKDVLLPLDTLIENFDFKENEIICVSKSKTVGEDIQRIPLKAQYITREFCAHPTRSEKDEMIYYFIFCKFQIEDGFTYSDFADAFDELITKRSQNNEGFVFPH